MEIRHFRVFLSRQIVLLGGLVGCLDVVAQQTPPPVIEPDLERRQITEADIDSEDFEVGVFGGYINIEDFESSSVVGATLTYHVSENLFTELRYGQASAGETSFEKLSGGAPFLTDDERDYRFYDLSVGYNFNGEVFVTDRWVVNTDVYLTLGGGSTDFGGDNRFTLVLGGGYRVLLTDYFALRLDVRDAIFSSELIGEEKDTHNIHYSLGATFFF